MVCTVFWGIEGIARKSRILRGTGSFFYSFEGIHVVLMEHKCDAFVTAVRRGCDTRFCLDEMHFFVKNGVPKPSEKAISPRRNALVCQKRGSTHFEIMPFGLDEMHFFTKRRVSSEGA